MVTVALATARSSKGTASAMKVQAWVSWGRLLPRDVYWSMHRNSMGGSLRMRTNAYAAGDVKLPRDSWLCRGNTSIDSSRSPIRSEQEGQTSSELLGLRATIGHQGREGCFGNTLNLSSILPALVLTSKKRNWLFEVVCSKRPAHPRAHDWPKLLEPPAEQGSGVQELPRSAAVF